jgi:hypothetical protein
MHQNDTEQTLDNPTYGAPVTFADGMADAVAAWNAAPIADEAATR